MGILEHQKLDRANETETIDILARTIWGEARGENLAGKNAVASVILNRYAVSQTYNGYWWGKTVMEICKKPYQFSCWNDNDVNYKKLMSVDSTDENFVQCKRIASRAVRGILDDITNGADHYHTVSIKPKWANDSIAVCDIGNHLFYKLVD